MNEFVEDLIREKLEGTLSEAGEALENIKGYSMVSVKSFIDKQGKILESCLDEFEGFVKKLDGTIALTRYQITSKDISRQYTQVLEEKQKEYDEWLNNER